MSSTNIEVIDFLIATKNKKGLFDIISLILNKLTEIEEEESAPDKYSYGESSTFNKVFLLKSLLKGIEKDPETFSSALNGYINTIISSLRNDYLQTNNDDNKKGIKDNIHEILNNITCDFSTISVMATDDENYEITLEFWTKENEIRVFSNHDRDLKSKNFDDFSTCFDTYLDLLLEKDIVESEIIKDW